MKLFECTNGYTGSSYSRVYVIAEDAETAKVWATESFRETAEQFNKRFPSHRYDETYWNNIQVMQMCPDTSVRYASGVLS